ncbi:MAG: phosphogluconate dehydrogenase (NAD(+)-dependent, decarboxylating), partial [Steroidobacteraceae bacterium]
GLGRMGGNMVRRLQRGGHAAAVYDRYADNVAVLAAEGAQPADSLAALAKHLRTPRTLWIMVPAGAVDAVIAGLMPWLARDDVVIDGGNTHHREDLRRAAELAARGIHYVDVGTSGGVLGLEQGYCLMVGGEKEIVRRLAPIFDALAPPGGWLHCGSHGAGHFVKMVHNGIEYGMMAAYAEGLNLLEHAGAGLESRRTDAETAPFAHAHEYRYELDVAAIAEVWRHGSIITSRLLDITAAALASDPRLERFTGRVSDSGEGRWTVQAAVDTGVPAYVLTAALYARFASRGAAGFADRVLSAMRLGFGGHAEHAEH